MMDSWKVHVRKGAWLWASAVERGVPAPDSGIEHPVEFTARRSRDEAAWLCYKNVSSCRREPTVGLPAEGMLCRS